MDTGQLPAFSFRRHSIDDWCNSSTSSLIYRLPPRETKILYNREFIFYSQISQSLALLSNILPMPQGKSPTAYLFHRQPTYWKHEQLHTSVFSVLKAWHNWLSQHCNCDHHPATFDLSQLSEQHIKHETEPQESLVRPQQYLHTLVITVIFLAGNNIPQQLKHQRELHREAFTHLVH